MAYRPSLQGKNRKPLVLRGARQVGKTWLVRDFAQRHGLEWIELNLERSPSLSDLSSEDNPAEIIHNIGIAIYGMGVQDHVRQNGVDAVFLGVWVTILFAMVASGKSRDRARLNPLHRPGGS
jgi:MoxR-like ATPase